MADVKKFLKKAAADKSFRQKLARAGDVKERETILRENGLSFTPRDFEEGFRALHVQCQTREEADLLHELKNWWMMIQSD